MIPDYCEAITAWRSFDAFPNGLLMGEAFGEPWPTFAPMVARCGAVSGDGWHEHVTDGGFAAAPVRGCNCGIHALKSREEALGRASGKRYSGVIYGTWHTMFGHGQPTPAKATVWGAVKLWGRIVEHELGYRAEYAYPAELFCDEADVAAAVACLYGVPCVVKALPLPVYGLDFGTVANLFQVPRGLLSVGYYSDGSGDCRDNTLQKAPSAPVAATVAPPSAVGMSSWQKRQAQNAQPTALTDTRDWRSILRGIAYVS